MHTGCTRWRRPATQTCQASTENRQCCPRSTCCRRRRCRQGRRHTMLWQRHTGRRGRSAWKRSGLSRSFGAGFRRRWASSWPASNWLALCWPERRDVPTCLLQQCRMGMSACQTRCWNIQRMFQRRCFQREECSSQKRAKHC